MLISRYLVKKTSVIFDFLYIAQPPETSSGREKEQKGKPRKISLLKVKGKINEERRTKQKQGEEVII